MDPHTYWTKLAEQAPSLVVLVLLVGLFLNFLKELLTRFEDIEDRQAETLSTISDSCHAFQRDLAEKSHQTITKVGTALDRNTEALARNSYALDRALQHFEANGSGKR